jgi:alkylation response protein AidB-like acyl-CoA dehydrogenase
MHDPGLNFDLGDTIDSLRDAIQNFAADEIAPRAADIDRDNLFPVDLWKKLGELGLHGMTVKEDTAAPSSTPVAHRAMEEVSRASASVGCRMARLRPVRQPDPPQQQPAQKAEIPAQAGQRRACGRWR